MYARTCLGVVQRGCLRSWFANSWVESQHVGSDSQRCCDVSPRMPSTRRSRILHTGQLSLASLRGRLIEYRLRLGKGGNVTSGQTLYAFLLYKNRSWLQQFASDWRYSSRAKNVECRCMGVHPPHSSPSGSASGSDVRDGISVWGGKCRVTRSTMNGTIVQAARR